MRTIIIGTGEIGKALSKILCNNYICYNYDKKDMTKFPIGNFDIMHICFPYSKDFIKEVKRYKKIFDPTYIVIHSTVPVGTNKKLGSISSPVLGIHPHLEKSLLTFTKFIGGKNTNEVADYFRRAGMKVYVTDDSNATELMKIMDTTYYGMCIEYTKQVKEECDKNKIPFELWTLWTNNYNEGYNKLGYSEFIRPNLVPLNKKIGGHCVLNNTNFLDNDFTKLIKKRNEQK